MGIKPGLPFRPGKNIDKILFITAILVLLLGNSISIGKRKVIEGKSVTLVFSQWWEDALEPKTLNALIGEFEKTHPGVRIKLDNRSYHEMEDLILNGLNDKSNGLSDSFIAGDILALDSRWLYGLIHNDMLEPLAPYKKDFIPALQPKDQENRYDEWALPLVSFMAPLFYNIEVLSAGGFDRPPKTWQDLERYAQGVTHKETGTYGLALALSERDPQSVYLDVYSWIWASGTVIINQGRPNFTDPAVIDTLQFLKNLAAAELIAPQSFSKTREQKLKEFTAGRIGMMIASVQDVEIVRKALGENFGITTIPTPGREKYQGKPAFGLTNWYAGISKGSEHKALAWEFVSFLAQQSPLLAAASHAVPGSGNGLEEYLKKDAFYSKAYNIYEGGDGIQEFAGYPEVHVLDFIVRNEIFRMFEENQSPQDTAGAIQHQWEEYFKKWEEYFKGPGSFEK
ncbi:MAG: extracellular solute-binding protein [Spirochaetaceae bacterium]|jgi:multiple sugar transport system substrate-binding protein|nr:extracellular solute-binding protein [Spirochaetaceae bacterium]